MKLNKGNNDTVTLCQVRRHFEFNAKENEAVRDRERQTCTVFTMARTV